MSSDLDGLMGLGPTMSQGLGPTVGQSPLMNQGFGPTMGQQNTWNEVGGSTATMSVPQQMAPIMMTGQYGQLSGVQNTGMIPSSVQGMMIQNNSINTQQTSNFLALPQQTLPSQQGMMSQPIQQAMIGQPIQQAMIGQPIQQGMMGQPMRTAPAPPSQLNLQASSSNDNLILSRSFNTSPATEHDFDPLSALTRSDSIQQPNSDVGLELSAAKVEEDVQQIVQEQALQDPQLTTKFYIDEADAGEPATNQPEVELTEEDKQEENKEVVDETKEDNESPTPATTKKGFFSRFSRSSVVDKAPIIEKKDSEESDDKDTTVDADKSKEDSTPSNDSKEKGRGGNDQKFMGEGQAFKGKLIGVLEVKDARGDKMCQDALQELKMAIKASGEHKQKINIQIAVDGLKIRDEKTGDCLYHHPVHKISFIAQDMTDGRAFGYIYGSPENGHRFFGIKTEKASGQVVVAMRDLFQVVFELKKKEIEEAKNGMDNQENQISSAASFPTPIPSSSTQSCVDDLLGLESQISAIQAGIQQIDKITPTPPLSFQTDSMIPFSLTSSSGSHTLPHAPPATLELSGTLARSSLGHPVKPPVVPVQPKKPVAVMNTNPPKTNGFDTAPFLPPPPSKPGRRVGGPGVNAPEDKYAVLGSISIQNSQPQIANLSSGPSQLQGIFTLPSSGPGSTISNDAQSTPPTNTSTPIPFNSAFGFNQNTNQLDNSMFGSNTFASNNIPSAPQPSSFNQLPGFGGSSSAAFGQLAGGVQLQNQPQAQPQFSSFAQLPLAASSSELLGSLQPVVAQPSAFQADSSLHLGAGYQQVQQVSQVDGGLAGYQQVQQVSQVDGGQAKINSFAGLQAQQPTKTPDVFGNLDSLFTDLDPLGTGKSKPYVDKKDFFVHKQSPMGSGVGSSKDSLSNVGLDDNLWDSICPPQATTTTTTNPISECNVLTKPLTTLSSSSSIPCRGTQRQLSENSLRVALPPEDSRLSVSPGDQFLGSGGINAHSSYGSILELEASPRRYRNNDVHDIYSTSQESPTFSTRFEEHKDSSVDSSINIPMPAEPPPALPERPHKSNSRSPPPLPPKKQAYNNFISNFNRDGCGSRPESATRDIYECAPVYESSDMLNINHSQPLSSTLDTNQSRSIEQFLVTDLVKMSVLELSQKLSEGKLPQHLTGMSLVELVDYLSKYSHQEPLATGSSKSHESLSPRLSRETPPARPPMVGSLQSYGFRSNISEASLNSESIMSTSKSPEPDLNVKSHNSPSQSGSYTPASASNLFESRQSLSLSHTHSQKSIGGFEDDFSQFNPIPSVSISNVDTTQQPTQPIKDEVNSDSYDRYAVFRELQMEEELVNAWKSPENEGSPVEEANDDIPTEVNVEANNGICDMNASVESGIAVDDDLMESKASTPDVNGDQIVEEIFVQESLNHGPDLIANISLVIDESVNSSNDVLDNSESIHEEKSSIYNESVVNQEENEESIYTPNNQDESKSEWAHFDTETNQSNFEFSQFLSNDEQARMLGQKRSSSFFNAEFMRRDSYTKLSEQKSEDNENTEEGKKKFSSPKALKDLSTAPSSLQARYQNFQRFDQSTPVQKSPKSSFKSQRLFPEDEGDPFGSSDWEPALYASTPGFDTHQGSGAESVASRPEEGGWDISFQAGEHEDTMFEPRKPSSRGSGGGNLEEAFPAVGKSGRSSSRASSENMFSSPFGDNFVPTPNHSFIVGAGGRTASATPPVYEGDRISNASELSCQSGDMLRPESDLFASESGFDEFKIEAKVGKSDSVNIFSVAEDPFDDDFFKMT